MAKKRCQMNGELKIKIDELEQQVKHLHVSINRKVMLVFLTINRKVEVVEYKIPISHFV